MHRTQHTSAHHPIHRVRAVLAAATLLLSGVALPVQSQEPGEAELHGRDMHGVVIAADDGAPLAGAFVRLMDEGVSELTHEDGTFHLEGVPPGRHTVRVERLGYRSAEVEVEVADEGTADVRIELETAAIEISPVVVTATARARSAGESLQPVAVVSAAELLRQLEGTVAATIRDEAGVTLSSMGPATAKPVIRGLSGDRVLMLEDGQRVADLSASSADHATATDPLSARSIEVVRGPAALLYGSNALGGVVNVIREEVPRSLPHRLTGGATLEASSVNDGVAGGGEARFGLGSSVAVRLEGTARTSGDLATPVGPLENTSSETLGLAAGASWIVEEAGYAGASVRAYRNEYGIPGGFTGAHEEGVRVEMRRDQLKVRAEWLEGVGPVERFELTASATDYHHEEIEANGALGTAFDRRTMTGEGRIHHEALGPLESGAAGMRIQWDDHAFGGFLDTEDARRATLGFYLVETLRAGPATFEGGIRYDWGRVTPDRTFVSPIIGRVRERTFSALSGSLGALLPLGSGLTAGANVSRAFRIPDIGELYSEGPHLAAYSFEVGDPSLEEEVGTGIDLILRAEGDVGRGELVLFRNWIDEYVFPRNTGRISRVQLPIYQFAGEDALLTGVEASGQWAWTERLATDATLSWVRGTLTAADESIPFMPPLKGSGGVRYETPDWFVEGGVRAAAEQDRIGEFETPTDGYVVWDASAGLRVELAGHLHSVTLRLQNLTDREYRNHLSRTKEIMPEAGRGASLLYRVTF